MPIITLPLSPQISDGQAIDAVPVMALFNGLAASINSGCAPATGSTNYAPATGSTNYAGINGDPTKVFSVQNANSPPEAISFEQALGLGQTQMVSPPGLTAPLAYTNSKTSPSFGVLYVYNASGSATLTFSVGPSGSPISVTTVVGIGNSCVPWITQPGEVFDFSWTGGSVQYVYTLLTLP
jgi:hypothetical protein